MQGLILFHVIVAALLAVDLGLNKKMTMATSLTWTAIWILVASAFGAGVWHYLGERAGSEFFSAYLVEKSMSVDNLFVFMVIFNAFSMNYEQQHKLLVWGIIGAILLRGGLIFAGTGLVAHYHWVLYIFAGVLALTGLKLLFSSDDEEPTPPFLTNLATPFLSCLVCIEVSDLIFAFDSIPATFAITQSPFVAYTANIFAILGLRSLFFAVSAFLSKFSYLKYGISAILIFIAAKIMLDTVFEITTLVSLAVIGLCLGGSILASIMADRQVCVSDYERTL